MPLRIFHLSQAVGLGALGFLELLQLFYAFRDRGMGAKQIGQKVSYPCEGVRDEEVSGGGIGVFHGDGVGELVEFG